MDDKMNKEQQKILKEILEDIQDYKRTDFIQQAKDKVRQQGVGHYE